MGLGSAAMSGLVDGLYPRAVDLFVQNELLTEFPALMVVGPRASGKSTSMQAFADETLDLSQPGIRQAALDDPDGILRRSTGTVLIDEWQEAPEILGAVKRAVDNDRENTAGRFIVTGSVQAANDARTWAGTGRIFRVQMYGLTQAELGFNASYNPIDAFFDMAGSEFQPSDLSRDDYLHRIVSGRFPNVIGKAERARSLFYRSYIEQLLTKDARQVADRDPQPAKLKAVLSSCAARTGKELNKQATRRDAEVTAVTANGHLDVLEGLSVIARIPAWDTNRVNRIQKAPKLVLTDTGMAAHLLNTDANAIGADSDLVGSFFETFVGAELLTHQVTAQKQTTVSHLRTKDQLEVDVVLEQAGAIVGLEVKSATSVSQSDSKGLRWLKDKLGDTFRFGAVLYTGQLPYQIEEGIWALPISCLWESPLSNRTAEVRSS